MNSSPMLLAAEINAVCTEYSIHALGMAAENEQRRVRGESMAYDEAAFVCHAKGLRESLSALRAKYIELSDKIKA